MHDDCCFLQMQWYVNGGKCGVCGDPWTQKTPRNNEAGGLFGNGIITRTYTESQVRYGNEICQNKL